MKSSRNFKFLHVKHWLKYSHWDGAKHYYRTWPLVAGVIVAITTAVIAGRFLPRNFAEPVDNPNHHAGQSAFQRLSARLTGQNPLSLINAPSAASSYGSSQDVNFTHR